jgi:Domain of unknown function (DUF2427)
MFSERWALLGLLGATFLLPLAVAHGNDDHNGGTDMDMSGSAMSHDGAIVAPAISPEAFTALDCYFRLNTGKGLLYGHIVLMTLGWVVVLPIGMLQDSSCTLKLPS